MNEYELYTRILSPHLKPDKQDILIEDKHLHKPHKCTVIQDAVDEYSLYRYDFDEQKGQFFPFFNKAHTEEGKIVELSAPNDLLKFCDYIILARKGEKLYVILVEMKSGTDEGAEKQLEATETFMEYIRHTAERIKTSYDYRSFSSSNIKTKKIVIKPVPGLKTGTNKAKGFVPDWNAPVVKLLSATLPLSQFCR